MSARWFGALTPDRAGPDAANESSFRKSACLAVVAEAPTFSFGCPGRAPAVTAEHPI
jgi:hypothetical protein